VEPRSTGADDDDRDVNEVGFGPLDEPSSERPSLADVPWIPYIAVERFDVVAVGVE
jgi:hypothetical protein